MTSLELLALAMPVLTAAFVAVFALNVHRLDDLFGTRSRREPQPRPVRVRASRPAVRRAPRN